MTATRRLHFLDNLRIAALGLLVVYHVGMFYVPWAWHVKSAHPVAALEPWMRLLNPWRMSLLFLISGAVSAASLQRASRGWLRARMRRLGWPLLAGVLVIVPPQAWFQVREQFGYGGSYLEFLRLYYSAHDGFCDAVGACLVLPTWNHLWFLPYLMVYTLLLWALQRRWPTLLDRAGAWLAGRLGAVTLLWGPWALLATLTLALRPWFEVTHNLVSDPLAHAQYLPAFLAGAVAVSAPGAWAAVERLRFLALGLWLTAWALGIGFGEQLPLPVLRAGFSLQQWCGVLAALGFGHRHLASNGPVQRWLSQRVFPVYVLHQTWIIVLVVAVRPLAWPPALEGGALLLATLAFSLALAELAVRVRWLAPWLGGVAR